MQWQSRRFQRRSLRMRSEMIRPEQQDHQDTEGRDDNCKGFLCFFRHGSDGHFEMELVARLSFSAARFNASRDSRSGGFPAADLGKRRSETAAPWGGGIAQCGSG